MTCYRWDLPKSIHLGPTTCLLCREEAKPGLLLSDLDRAQFTSSGCHPLCTHCLSPRSSIWFHQHCYDILASTFRFSLKEARKSKNAGGKPTFADLQKFAMVRNYLYKPSETEQESDALYIRKLLASGSVKYLMESVFRHELFQELPLEIQILIAEYVGQCWCLILLGETRQLIEELCMEDCGERECEEEIDLTKDVYIVEHSYNGHTYISRIGNSLFNSSNQLHLRLPDNITRIIVSIDHVGVRHIQFMEQGANPVKDGSPWYEINDVSGSNSKLKVTHNGLFVRSIRVLSKNSDDVATPQIWRSPHAPVTHPWNTYRFQTGGRLYYVEINSDIKGIVFWGSNLTLNGFCGVSKKSVDIYRLRQLYLRCNQLRPYWIFFPLNKGEFIQAAWLRKSAETPSPRSGLALIIHTTSGRTATFGAYIAPDQLHTHSYHPLVRDGDGMISGLFHDGFDPQRREISEIGVTCTGQYHVCSPSPKPQVPPIEPYLPPAYSPWGPVKYPWYMTKAALDGLAQVQVCHDLTRSPPVLLGMLLYYEDGRSEALGQLHWDSDLTQKISIPILFRTGIRSKLMRVIDIKEAAAWAEIGSDGQEWQELPSSGTVVWWFGSFGETLIVYPE